jgi:hypothetical protein
MMLRLYGSLTILLVLLAGCNLSMGSSTTPAATPAATKTLTTNQVPPATTPGTLPTLAVELVGATATDCAARTDWERYIVERGDNLSKIADRFSSTVQELIAANCLSNPNSLRAGQLLYVPKSITPPVTATSSGQ